MPNNVFKINAILSARDEKHAYFRHLDDKETVRMGVVEVSASLAPGHESDHKKMVRLYGNQFEKMDFKSQVHRSIHMFELDEFLGKEVQIGLNPIPYSFVSMAKHNRGEKVNGIRFVLKSINM